MTKDTKKIIQALTYLAGKEDGKVHRLDGKLDELSMTLIANGVKLSPDVERRIKDLF